MIESTINQREMTNFAMHVNTESVARSNIDTTEFENEINRWEKASYAELKNTKGMEIQSMLPQLAEPKVHINNIIVLSIGDVLKQFGGIIEGIPISELKNIVESVKDKSDKRWQAFEDELNNLIKAQDRLEISLAALKELKANPDTPEVVFEKAKREAEEAFKNITATLEKLNTTIRELPSSADARRLQKLMNAKPILSLLDYLLLRVQEAQAEYMLTLPDLEFEMYAQLQEATQQSLETASENMQQRQAEQRILFEVTKWLTLAVTTALTFASGGSLSFVLGFVSAAFVAIDFGTDGAITENIFAPIMDNTLAPLLEKMITGLTDLLVEAGYPESAAMAISAAVTVIAIAVVTYVAGKAISAAAGSIAEREAVKAGLESAKASLSATFSKLPNWSDDTINFFFGTLENYLHRMSQLQVGLMVFGTGAETSVQIASGVIEKAVKDFEALTTLLTDRNEVIKSQYDKASERVVDQIQKRNEYDELRSDLMNSYKNSLLSVIRGAA